MAPAPAVVIIARHGARLDAADKSWHLTSPTPYDPPLTYGGWSQCRALGVRIGSLLHQREQEQESEGSIVEEDEANGAVNGSAPSSGTVQGQKKKGRKKKQKIVIHTSPFMRCLQTSVAISAGISQYNGSQTSIRDRANSLKSSPLKPVQRATSVRGTGPKDFRPLVTQNLVTQLENIVNKPILRIDAFLGEWNTPNYYEQITPPPNSTLMVAGAMATLRRKAEAIDVAQPMKVTQGNFPGGWSKPSTPSAATAGNTNPFDAIGALKEALPHHRASSMGNSALAARLSRLSGVKNVGYTPPTPVYAVSPSEPIPRGYCAHARDACLDLELDWDSTRPPLNWPDGGQLGEEWSAMHQRFRTGLTEMIRWYRGHGMELHVHEDHHDEDMVPEDDEPELILILVTHAAGWNALVGALTDQPVLRDVGTASLTMAIRKEPEERRSSINSTSSNASSNPDSSALSNLYEMRVIASTEHLRPGADPAKPSFTASPIIKPTNTDQTGRRARMPTLPDEKNDALAAFKLPHPAHQSAMSMALNGIRRSGSNPPPRTTRSVPSPPTPAAVPDLTASPLELTDSPRSIAALWGAAAAPQTAPAPRSSRSATLSGNGTAAAAAAMPTGRFLSNEDPSDPRHARAKPPPPERKPSLGLWVPKSTSTSATKSNFTWSATKPTPPIAPPWTAPELPISTTTAAPPKTAPLLHAMVGPVVMPGMTPPKWLAGDTVKRSRPAGLKRRWTLGQDEEHEFLVLN